MEKIGDELANLQVLDEGGIPHRLADLWAKRPVLLLWVRHFG